MKRINHILSTLLIFTIVVGCQELDVENPNDPNRDILETDESLVLGLASGAMAGIFDAYTAIDDNGAFFNSNVHLAWTADHTSMSNNFRSMWSAFKTEPRVPFNNSLTFPDLGIISNPWQDWNGAIFAANVAIDFIEAIPAADRTDEQTGALGLAYMAKGMAFGHLANVFDQAYLESETDIENNVYVLGAYDQVLTQSIDALDEAISIFNSGISYTPPSNTFNGQVYTEAQLAAFSNTLAAHYIVSNSRNATQNAAVDWAQVRSYAQNGSDEDLVVTDDGQVFSHDFFCLTGLFWYFRIDHRVLRHFNPTYPKRFSTETDAVIAESVLSGAGYNGDQRLDAYFEYSADLSFFRLERGPQLRTHYYQDQFETFFTTDNCIGPVSYMKGYMNDLLLAEAENELGNTNVAIGILNDATNPRTAVGSLPNIDGAATQAEVRALIFAERDIELGRSIFGVEHQDMRRQDALQDGTILHFPVPADELAVLGLDAYTYGGPANGDGENTSDGSNSWLND